MTAYPIPDLKIKVTRMERLWEEGDRVQVAMKIGRVDTVVEAKVSSRVSYPSHYHTYELVLPISINVPGD